MAIEVVKPGLSTTVQDLGRPGYYHIGIPISGGMDRLALRAANLLVGNAEDAAVLEASFLGPELEFTSEATVAVTGAELPPKVDGVAARDLDFIHGEEGPDTRVRFSQERAHAPISPSPAASTCPSCSGRRSTYTLGALGGHQGRKLAAGDKLELGAGAGAPEGRTRRAASAPGARRRSPSCA